MTIHFTPNGIFADTEEERLAFYDRLTSGDPSLAAEIIIWQQQCEIKETNGG